MQAQSNDLISTTFRPERIGNLCSYDYRFFLTHLAIEGIRY